MKNNKQKLPKKNIDLYGPPHEQDEQKRILPYPAEEGEPWLVSYADMMTLLFGFFVVMYSFAARDPKSEDCVKLRLMEAFRDESIEQEKNPDNGLMQGAAMRALQMLVTMMNLESVDDVLEKIEKATADKSSKETDGGETKPDKKLNLDALKALLNLDEMKRTVVVAIPTDVMFKPGSTILTVEMRKKIADIAQSSREYPDIESIEISGHTDSQSANAPDGIDNWSLSVLRASSVAKVFGAVGVKENLLRIVGRGSSAPLVPEKDGSGRWLKENMAKNRRIEIEIRREPRNEKK
ncbi:MAG: OmpA family protein [Proteobacteria bacterium]|nr:OmpA family protein [Pseudomonadota bacterium]